MFKGRIGIIGLGVVGRATLTGFRCFGYDVWGYDKDSQKTECDEIQDADIYFVCTPEQAVEDVISQLAGFVTSLIVVRSTTPPGTIAKLQQKFERHICHNPEFLRERNALDDFMFPDRIVIGECCKEHGDILAFLYEHFHAPIIRVTPTISETIKIVTNAWLYTQIEFWNEVKEKCEALGIPPQVVANAVTMDPRISNYGSKMIGNKPGGKCLPKDFRHWKNIGLRHGSDSK